ncbi:MAG: sigma-70 family RNA polymerase sigma factor [Candidatus Bipolaricaulota bacterium]|nr:sigma-70 family RNA polymerase sigma factor [Candidatus Bipolaricaulota bacterium]
MSDGERTERRTRSIPFGRLENEELIDLLRKAGDGTHPHVDISRLREEIVKRNIGLVKSIAAKFLTSGEPLDDLIQAGYIGLLNAVANFDLARNTRFSTYATYLIQGEIRHFIRDKHAPIRVPQWVQTMNRRIKEAEESLFKERGRAPTLAELATSLELTPDQLAALLRGRQSMTYVSIDRERRSSDPNPSPPSLDEVLPLSGEEMPLDTRLRIVVAIEQLAEIQQQILEGLFYRGKSQFEVGKELGISQRQVSRIKERALSDLRGTLRRSPSPADAETGEAHDVE